MAYYVLVGWWASERDSFFAGIRGCGTVEWCGSAPAPNCASPHMPPTTSLCTHTFYLPTLLHAHTPLHTTTHRRRTFYGFPTTRTHARTAHAPLHFTRFTTPSPHPLRATTSCNVSGLLPPIPLPPSPFPLLMCCSSQPALSFILFMPL